MPTNWVAGRHILYAFRKSKLLLSSLLTAPVQLIYHHKGLLPYFTNNIPRFAEKDTLPLTHVLFFFKIYRNMSFIIKHKDTL